MKDWFKKYYPYLVVLASFCLALIILIILLDTLILPALIHSKDTVKVPNVVGMNMTDAERMLTQNNFQIAKVAEQYNDKIAPGIIMNQSPKADQPVKSGRSIYLTVSKGLETVPVPYVIGQPTRTARILFKNKGLDIGNIDYIASDVYGPDTVITQKTQSGSNISYGSKIDIVVSKGAEGQVKVPNIVQLSLEDAKSILTGSALGLGMVTYQKSETLIPNTIMSQNPLAGELVPKNTTINVVISK